MDEEHAIVGTRVQIVNAHGLHMRPSSRFVALALTFRRLRRQFPAIFRSRLTWGGRPLRPAYPPPNASLSLPRWLARSWETRSLGPGHTG
jgi:hypothetical protein